MIDECLNGLGIKTTRNLNRSKSAVKSMQEDLKFLMAALNTNVSDGFNILFFIEKAIY